MKLFYFLALALQALALCSAGVTVKTWQYWVVILCTAATAGLWAWINTED